MKDIAHTLKNMDKFFWIASPIQRAGDKLPCLGMAYPPQLSQVFLDHVEDLATIKLNLDSLAILSHQMDIAIGIGHMKPITLEVLKKEIPRLESEGYRFISLSQAVR